MVKFIDPIDQIDPTRMATAKAIPRTPPMVRQGQCRRWRVTMFHVWGRASRTTVRAPRTSRYCGGAGGSMATAGGSQAALLTARTAPMTAAAMVMPPATT